MNRRANFVVFGVSVLLCLVLLEAAAAYIFGHSEVTNGKKLVLTAVSTGDRYVRIKDGFIIPHPYMLYTNRPGFADDAGVQIDSLGYRGHEIKREKPPGTYRVLALGGSTTLSWPYIEDPNATWSALIETDLTREYPGRRFEVVNAGLAYATSAELLSGYMFRHRYLDPDLVIIHAGGNDVDPLMYEHYNPEYVHFRASGVSVFVGRAERLLLKSNVVRILCAYCWRGVPSVYVPRPYDFEKLPRDAALRRVENTYPLGFERNIDLLVRTIREDGAAVLLVGFVQAREEKVAENVPGARGLERAMTLGVQKDNAVLAEIAAKNGVPYLDPSSVHFEDGWFVDNCHLTEAGERFKADWILAGARPLVAPH